MQRSAVPSWTLSFSSILDVLFRVMYYSVWCWRWGADNLGGHPDEHRSNQPGVHHHLDHQHHRICQLCHQREEGERKQLMLGCYDNTTCCKFLQEMILHWWELVTCPSSLYCYLDFCDDHLARKQRDRIQQFTGPNGHKWSTNPEINNK